MILFQNTKRKEDLLFICVRVPLVVVASKIKLIFSLLTLPPKFSSLFCECYVCDIQMRKDEKCCNIGGKREERKIDEILELIRSHLFSEIYSFKKLNKRSCCLN